MRKFIKEMPIAGSIVKNISSARRQIKSKIGSYIFYRKNKKFLSENKTLSGSASGKRCFILATGPSVNSQNLRTLKSELVITLSNFFVHKDFSEINPEYHIFAASHDPITDEQMVLWFQDAEKHFKNGQKILLSITDRYLIENSKLFTKQKVYYYCLNHVKKLKLNEELDFTTRLPKIGTVTHLAMYLAFFIGAKEINLLGVDHNLFPDGPSVKDHFYENNESALFRAGYRPREKAGPASLENTFRSFLTLWGVYKKIKEYADSRAVKIFNCSPLSTLDVFPKKDLMN
jgi:hypothetical protein